MSNSFSAIDLVIVIGFLVLALSIGLFTGRKIKNFKDYLFFYKNYNSAFLGLSLTMVIFGSGTIIGAISEMYQVGIIYIVASVGYIVNSLITAKFIIPKMDHRFSSMITVSDMMKYFYGHYAEKFSAIIAVMFDVGALATQLMVIGKVLSYFFFLDYSLCLVLAGIIMIIYSALGGIRAITIMDSIKCFMLLTFFPFLASIFVYKAGGMIPILQNTPSKYLSIINNADFIKYGVLFVFFMIPVHMLQPIVIQRILLINDSNVSSKSMYIYALIRFILIWVTVAIALSTLCNYQQSNSQNLLYEAIFKVTTSGTLGIILTSILAVVMCKADAHLNSSGIILAKNIILSNGKASSNINTLNIVRASTIAIGVVGLILASLNLSIIKVIVFIEALWGITIGLPLIVSIFGITQKRSQFWWYIVIMLPLFAGLYIFDHSYSTPLIGLLTGAYIFLMIHYHTNRKEHKKKNYFFNNNLFKKLFVYIYDCCSIFKEISEFSTNHVEKVGADYFSFAVFFGVNYTIPVFMWGSAKEYLVISAVLRGIAIILCFILLMKNFWPTKAQKYFALFWHFVLTYTLSFLPISGLYLSTWSASSLIDVVLSILLLIVLTDWLLFIIIITFGAVLSFIFSKIALSGISFPTDVSTVYLAGYSILFAMLIGGVFARRKEEQYDEKLRLATMFGGVVAHEMRTFLLGIKNYVRGSSKFLSVLLHAYDTAEQNKLVPDKLTPFQKKGLKNANRGIEAIVRKAFVFIDNLLVNIKGPSESEETNNYSILAVIKEAINSYPLSDIEKKIINIQVSAHDDFVFKGNKEIMVHIIYNLISNALYFVANQLVPTIKINTDVQGNKNCLIIEDNGKGIDKRDINKVFNKFFSKGKKGTGLGLSFCRVGIKSMRGNIECFSIPNKYTKFVLSFPKI